MFQPSSIFSRVALLLGLALPLGLALAGCCSADPEDLSDRDPDVRREALACLGEAAIDDPHGADAAAVRAAALRLSDAANEEHAGVRATAQRVLEGLRAREAAAPSAARVSGGPDQDPSAWTRAAAASTLGGLGGAESVAGLRRALQGDPDQDVRLAAARELGELEDGSGETTEALLEALRDEAASVRLNARRALRTIHASDLGLDPATWRAWLEARGWRPTAEVPPAPRPEEPVPTPWSGDVLPGETGGVPDESVGQPGGIVPEDEREPVDPPGGLDGPDGGAGAPRGQPDGAGRGEPEGGPR